MNLKNLARDPRLRGIVKKHIDALSRDLAEELSQPLLDQLGLTPEDLVAPIATTTPSVAAPVAPKALLYDKRSRSWICPKCELFSNPERRSVTTHLRFCTAAPKVQTTVGQKPQKPKTRRRQAKKKS